MCSIFCALVVYFKLQKFTMQTLSSPSVLDNNLPHVSSAYFSPHAPDNFFFKFLMFVLVAVLFCYATVNLTKIMWFLCCIFILLLNNLETCWRSLCREITSIKPKCICWSFNIFYAETLQFQPSCSFKTGSLLYEVPSSHDEFCVIYMASVRA